MTIAVLALGLAGLALGIGRAIHARRIERLLAERLPTGPGGVIIGAEPIALGPAAPGAVLLLHGFGDTPQSLRSLAEHLHARGHPVRVPLLPGHGRTLQAFAATGAEDWIAAARRAYDELRMTSAPVALVGLSMGGAVAAVLAALMPPDSLVLLAPYLGVPDRIRRPARAHRFVTLVRAYWPGQGQLSIHDPLERERGLAYGTYTARLIHELTRVVDRSVAALPAITAPTLVVQSRQDNRIASDVTERAFAQIGSPTKRLVWTDVGGHVITVDYGRQAVFEAVAGWIEGERDGATRGE